ncbi:hypothetical protein O6R05_04250 [Peptoniphilus equinus]|uniref:DUF6873 domain-containing protein n=1 Tax=Peptoniphilus equinus TaxID=3016343 RepID=A0ABY7QT27_9FIRM|nr:hypothetical protein [Peptoniphilus equinus]WBW49229.1 hypothetical protein O6R05_04250 [Peptoniphilus equinus]
MILLDEAARHLKASLKDMDTVVLTPRLSQVYAGINGHADLLVHKLDDSTLAVAAECTDFFKNLGLHYNVMPIEGIASPYPGHVQLNIAVFGKWVIHNMKVTPEPVRAFYERQGYHFIHVAQGYTKCNLVVGRRSLITSDVGIYRTLKDIAPILLVESEHVALKGFNYGFLGGASGLINDTLVFAGSLERHPSYARIVKFLDRQGESWTQLQGPLVDVGTLIQI